MHPKRSCASRSPRPGAVLVCSGCGLHAVLFVKRLRGTRLVARAPLLDAVLVEVLAPRHGRELLQPLALRLVCAGSARAPSAHAHAAGSSARLSGWSCPVCTKVSVLDTLVKCVGAAPCAESVNASDGPRQSASGAELEHSTVLDAAEAEAEHSPPDPAPAREGSRALPNARPETSSAPPPSPGAPPVAEAVRSAQFEPFASVASWKVTVLVRPPPASASASAPAPATSSTGRPSLHADPAREGPSPCASEQLRAQKLPSPGGGTGSSCVRLSSRFCARSPRVGSTSPSGYSAHACAPRRRSAPRAQRKGGGADETCPVSTGGGTRHVQLVREIGRASCRERV